MCGMCVEMINGTLVQLTPQRVLFRFALFKVQVSMREFVILQISLMIVTRLTKMVGQLESYYLAFPDRMPEYISLFMPTEQNHRLFYMRIGRMKSVHGSTSP